MATISGNQLKTLRKQLGLTQDQLAKKLSVTRLTIYKWENKKSETIPANGYRMIRKFVENYIGVTISNELVQADTKAISSASAAALAAGLSGLMFGPLGAAIGAVAGGITGSIVGSPEKRRLSKSIPCPECDEDLEISTIDIGSIYKCPECGSLIPIRRGKKASKN